MIALVQRAKTASVTVENKVVGKIDKGIAVFVGVFESDSEKECDFLAKKIANLRIFTDQNDKMNLSLLDIDGSALVISNFTLCADAKKGNRPSYIAAKEPREADRLYDYFCKKLYENSVKKVERGVFGADMQVDVSNDGPISIVLDTEKIMPQAR